MRIEAFSDPRLAFEVEQAAGFARGLAEVSRRYGVARGFLARSAEGAAVGVGTLALYAGADDAPALAWLGGMAVRPEARRKGAGRELVRAMLAAADDAGAPVVGLDASIMGRPLYEAEGFREVVRTSRWVRALPRADASVSAQHSVHPISVSEAMEVAQFDLPRFGARRMPFMMALLRDFPWHAFLARDRATGEVSGFLFASERSMGPLVADHEEAAAALLSAGERAGAPRALLARDDHAGARRVLEAAGYAPDGGACTRMTRGGRALPGRAASVYGAAAWALG